MNVFFTLLKLLYPLLQLLSVFSKRLSTMKSKVELIRLFSSNYSEVKCSITTPVNPTRHDVLVEMSYSRVTGDFHVVWTKDCTLSLSQRLKEVLRFLKLVSNVS